jgi:hypothetical protein
MSSYHSWYQGFISLFGVFAIGLWSITGLAFLSYLAGNPAAINAVIGAGFVAVFCTAFAILFLVDYVVGERKHRRLREVADRERSYRIPQWHPPTNDYQHW